MKQTNIRRITRKLTSDRVKNLKRKRAQIAQELPDLSARDQMRKEASDEPTLSGELRRAIHASHLSIEDIAAQAKIPPLSLDEFLTGERTLRSDVLDRLATSLGLELSAPD